MKILRCNILKTTVETFRGDDAKTAESAPHPSFIQETSYLIRTPLLNGHVCRLSGTICISTANKGLPNGSGLLTRRRTAINPKIKIS